MKKNINFNKKVPQKNNKAHQKKLRIMLIILFVFWSIGSLLSIFTTFNSCHSSITASAEDNSYTGSAPLTGLSSSYVDDFDINIFADSLTLGVASVGGLTLSSNVSDEWLSFNYDDAGVWKRIDCNFFNTEFNSSTVIPMEVKMFDNSYSLLDSTYSLRDILYTQYDTQNLIVSVSLRYNNGANNVWVILHFRSLGGFEYVLAKTGLYTVSYDEQYVNSLRLQINDLNTQISQLNATIVGLRADISAMEDMHEYEIEQLNAQLLSLSNTIAEKNAIIEELNAEIREITIGNQNAYNSGYATGFEEGASASAQEAYNQGYAAAVADGEGGGNFRSLIAALIDVPVNAVTSLFDWNLLGINLKSFFFSVLSCIIIIKLASLFVR